MHYMKEKALKKNRNIILYIVISCLSITSVVLLGNYFARSSIKKVKKAEFYTVVKKADNIYKGRSESVNIQKVVINPNLVDNLHINVTEGQMVNSGDTLLSYKQKDIDITSLEYAVKNAELSLSAAQALLDASKKNKNSSEDEILQKRQEVIAKQLALEEARVKLDEALAKKNVNVVSNTSGYVSFNKSDTSDNGLTVLVYSSKTRVVAKVTEFDYEKIHLDENVKVKILNSDKIILGKVKYISKTPIPSSENDKGVSTYQFIIKPKEPIQNGFGVQVLIGSDEIFIPKTAIHNGKVKLKTRDNKLKEVSVNSVPSGEEMKVISGLKEGDQILKKWDSK